MSTPPRRHSAPALIPRGSRVLDGAAVTGSYEAKSGTAVSAQRLSAPMAPSNPASPIPYLDGEETIGQRFFDLFLYAPVGIYAAVDGRVVRANRALARLLGYESEEALRGVATSLFFENPADQPAWVETGRNGPPLTSEDVAWRTHDGRALTVRLTGRVIAQASPRGTWTDVFVEDVTDARRVEAEMRQMQKAEGIGRLASEIAHDFNNLLTTILGYADLLLEQIDAAKPIHTDLREIQRASLHAAALTRQLLAYSRQQTRDTTVLDLHAVVRSMEPLLHRVLGNRVVLHITGTAEASRLRADRGQIEQVLMNLVINGRDAMPDGGTLTIETATARVPESRAGVADAILRPGAYVRLSVTDTGTGMDAATQARLFEPFFSTKGSGRGTGLGLAILDGIVRQLRGRIMVTSAPDHGSTFDVYLPASDQPVAPCAVESRAAVDMGRETILVVDDDPGVLALVSAVLTRHGYRVLTADGPEAALALIAADGPAISLMVIDVVMPGMTTPVLLARLETLGYTQAVYMSGYAAPDTTGWSRGRDAVFLAKPFTPRDLLAAVRRGMGVPATQTRLGATPDAKAWPPSDGQLAASAGEPRDDGPRRQVFARSPADGDRG